ncbi:low-density lipoprotein receptor-related protein 4-like isoform X2 [Lytechinus pictus]|uniref:low-density lipoprotein receptor-related protein 4-like isoform X2 n=1 Tax=Lytechinus pictus TaxID=7653 RepID=UPI0030BA0D40
MIWTDTLLEKIESANLDGSSRNTIIFTGLYLPWSITLSYKRKMLYWTEHGDGVYIGAKIEMATKYGFNRRVLVSTNISQPNGLALDSQEQRLYWTEGFYDVIESIDLDTLERQVHVNTESGGAFVWGISLYFDSIYFTELGSAMLYEADLGEEEIRIVSVHAFPVHVKIYANLTCPDPINCEGNSACELIGYDTPSCTCLPGYTGPTCLDEITCPLPSNENPSTHFVDPSPIYYNGQALVEVCDNGNDERTHVCNGFTGEWYTTTLIYCTEYGAKIFLTDPADSAIYVGDSSGPNFFSSSFQKLNVSGAEGPVGVDYDYRNEMVYWTDEGRGIISRAKLDGSMQEVLVDVFEGVGYPEGLVLDLEDERMIWTDTLLEKIESANLDGSSRNTIINTGLYLPWSITLSYKRKMLYWTEHGDNLFISSKIEMAEKDGLNRRALVSTRIKQPNGLALDIQEQRLYWTEGFYDVIESIDLDTLDRQVHVYTESGDAFVWGISLYFDSIYFSELGSSLLYEAEIGEEEIRIVSVHAFPLHVKIYANLTCPDSSHCQGHSRCELIGYETPSCTCLPGYTGSTCMDEITCPLPYNVNPDTHFVNPSPIYYNEQTLVEVCDNGNDERTHVCNGFTGDWYTATSIDCTDSGSKGAAIGISYGLVTLSVLSVKLCGKA